MRQEVTYALLECYPVPGSPRFGECASALAGCWIRGTGKHPMSEANIKRRCRENLRAAGFEVTGVWRRQLVSADTYRKKRAGRRYFWESLETGFSCHINGLTRESIGIKDAPSLPNEREIVSSARALLEGGMCGIYNREDKSWCVRETPRESFVFPIWSAVAHASRWADYFEGQPKTISLRAADAILKDMSDDEILIGLGVGAQSLVTVDARWLAALLRTGRK